MHRHPLPAVLLFLRLHTVAAAGVGPAGMVNE